MRAFGAEWDDAAIAAASAAFSELMEDCAPESLSERDRQYRAALGLSDSDPLPKSLGHIPAGRARGRGVPRPGKGGAVGGVATGTSSLHHMDGGE